MRQNGSKIFRERSAERFGHAAPVASAAQPRMRRGRSSGLGQPAEHTMAAFGTYKGIANGDQLVTEVEFEDFAPTRCVFLGCLYPEVARARMYARVYDNRTETNIPIAPFCCLTMMDQCVIDRVRVRYFDRMPTRASMCCFCMPFTCCGPPVIFADAPKCCSVDMTTLCGTDIKVAPCNCFDIKCFLCCGYPCYENSCCSCPYYVATKKPDVLLTKWQSATIAYMQRVGVPEDQIAVFRSAEGNVGCFGEGADIVYVGTASADAKGTHK